MSDQGSSGSGATTAVGRDGTGSAPAPARPERDWTDQVTDRVESTVRTVRDKTTVPITKVARVIVFGLLAGLLAIAALILVVVALLRVIDVYLPFSPYGRRVWLAYAVLGAIFLVAGAFCWTKRSPRKS